MSVQVEEVHQVAEQAGEAIPELPNFITLLSHRMHETPWVKFLHHWENLFFGLLVALFLALCAFYITRKPAFIPKKGQGLFEYYLEAIDGLTRSIIGEHGRRHTPLIATFFIYILLMNLSVLIPGFKSPTSNINTTVGLALVVFLYVQTMAVKKYGLLKYFYHLAGEPQDITGYVLVVLMLPLHLLEELIKPLSLSLRLCFNIFAEDVLLAIVAGLGITIGVALHFPIGIPFQILVVPLVLIFSTIQALVFSLLATVYIGLATAGEEHH